MAGDLKCGKCVFRSGMKAFRCNYAEITGRPRKAQPPEKCTYFLEGNRREAPMEDRRGILPWKKPEQPAAAEVRRQTSRAGEDLDWGLARELWEKGYSDWAISLQIGCTTRTVTSWRTRNKLKGNGSHRQIPPPEGGETEETDMAVKKNAPVTEPAAEKTEGLAIGKLAAVLRQLGEVYPEAVVACAAEGPVRRVRLEAETGMEEADTQVKITLM